MSRETERERALRRVQQLGFMADDLRLFLNTNPEAAEALCALKKYIVREREAREEYERRYGLLTLEGLEKADEYAWIHHAWPWEVED